VLWVGVFVFLDCDGFVKKTIHCVVQCIVVYGGYFLVAFLCLVTFAFVVRCDFVFA